MDPSSSTGKWSLKYAERISYSFSHGDNFLVISGKFSSRPGQENGKTVHEDNIISTVLTQGTNNNKYEETGICGSSVKKHCRSSSDCFC
jgi:hypothetical protein